MTIKTEAIMDGRKIEATSEVGLPARDLAAIGQEFELELRGMQVELMAELAKERRGNRKRGS